MSNREVHHVWLASIYMHKNVTAKLRHTMSCNTQHSIVLLSSYLATDSFFYATAEKACSASKRVIQLTKGNAAA